MFGTLVLTLPSAYTGGELRIRHSGREVTVAPEAADPSEISFAAFYADCEHEALPVRTGNRVCLVYNLIQERMGRAQRKLQAPNTGEGEAEAGALLEKLWKREAAPGKIVWLLDHQYSLEGLSWAALKGADAAKGRFLTQAARLAGCTVHLSVVHIGESGGVEEDGSAGRGSRMTPVSVDSTWQYLDEWLDQDGRTPDFGHIRLLEDELLPAGALDGEPPDEQRLMEASGNEGTTYERAYHRAALVIWPENRTANMLLASGVPAALPHLKRLAAKGPAGEALAAAKAILEAWPGDGDRNSFQFGVRRPDPADRVAMVEALTELKAAELLARFLSEPLAREYDGSENAALMAAAGAMGEEEADEALAGVVGGRMAAKPLECVELLRGLTADRERRYRRVAEAAVAGLDSVREKKPEPAPMARLRMFLGNSPERRMGSEFLENLMEGLAEVDGGALCGPAVERIGARPEVFDPVRMVVPAIGKLGAGKPGKGGLEEAMAQLWTGAAEYLLERSEQLPSAPEDWAQRVKIGCDCEDCHQLQAFAASPVERVRRFRINKERREHLQDAIEWQELEMTHVTERKGSPQTLVCTKDRRKYDARMRAYAAEKAAMRDLAKMGRPGGAEAKLRVRMEAAARLG